VISASIAGGFIQIFRAGLLLEQVLSKAAERYEVIAARDAADIMLEAIEKHMPDSDRLSVSEDDETEGRAGE